MIHIRVLHAFQIGDALCHVPFMKFLCDKHNTKAVVTGEFNKKVTEVLGPSYSLSFAEAARADVFDAVYDMHMATMCALHSRSGCHMAQSFFRHARAPMPELPLTLDLCREPSGVPSGIVISPYSHSDMNGNKFWPHDRWLAVVDKLWGLVHPNIYVIGSTARDDPTPYIRAGITPYFDQPLAKVLDLISQANVFLSVDNGIAHLAHYGAVHRHVLLYPGSMDLRWALNPYASVVIGTPIDIQPKAIIEAAQKIVQ